MFSVDWWKETNRFIGDDQNNDVVKDQSWPLTIIKIVKILNINLQGAGAPSKGLTGALNIASHPAQPWAPDHHFQFNSIQFITLNFYWKNINLKGVLGGTHSGDGPRCFLTDGKQTE